MIYEIMGDVLVLMLYRVRVIPSCFADQKGICPAAGSFFIQRTFPSYREK